jgi:dihydroorotate dehydrogenase (NAD+) catalytic subunit
VASIWGFSADEYRRAGSALRHAVESGRPGTGALVAVEANISCPNVEDRRRMFAHSRHGVGEAVAAAASGLAGRLPLWAKLSPNVTDLPELAGAAVEAGAGAVTLINTLMGLSLDPLTGRPRLGGGGGGLSGPAIHPVAVRAVFDCRAALPDVPIIGVGGVSTGEDAAELMAAGAHAVQVGTATFADPRAPARVLAELRAWCQRHGICDLDQLRGRAHDHP